jgi:beta-aspartyl-dipeptidase (metallo-type)
VIDASGCIVMPGLIDPHAHLVGAGGEDGFGSRMPEISFEQLIDAGVTTVVGLLGTDTVTREPRCLLAKVNQLDEEGITPYMYTGGFELPPRTITSSALDDVVLIDKVIGTGEIAISDSRWIDPPLEDLAYVVAQTALGGKMARKAGVTHFHVGGSPKRLSLLRTLLETYEIEPSNIYTTHITRSEALMEDAIQLARQGIFVDMDSVEENIRECLQYYLDHGGAPEQVTVSSDAHTPGGSPAKFFRQFTSCLQAFPVERVLPCFSGNAARALKLNSKGRLGEGCDGDVLVLRQGTYELVHLFARGRHVIQDGQHKVESRQTQMLEDSEA